MASLLRAEVSDATEAPESGDFWISVPVDIRVPRRLVYSIQQQGHQPVLHVNIPTVLLERQFNGMPGHVIALKLREITTTISVGVENSQNIIGILRITPQVQTSEFVEDQSSSSNDVTAEHPSSPMENGDSSSTSLDTTAGTAGDEAMSTQAEERRPEANEG